MINSSRMEQASLLKTGVWQFGLNASTHINSLTTTKKGWGQSQAGRTVSSEGFFWHSEWFRWQIKCKKKKATVFQNIFWKDMTKKYLSSVKYSTQTLTYWLGAVALKCTASKPRMVHRVSYDQPVTQTIIHSGMMVDGLSEFEGGGIIQVCTVEDEKDLRIKT